MNERFTGENRPALGDLTNTSGKRSLPLDSQILIAKDKIAKHNPDEKTQSSCSVKESDEADAIHTKGPEQNDSGVLGSMVDYGKGKNILPLGFMQSPKSEVLDFKGRFDQKNMFSSDFVPLESSEQGDPDVNKLGNDSVSVGGLVPNCSNSSTSSAELEDDECLGDHEADHVDPMRYDFLTKKGITKSAVSDQIGVDFAVLKESQAETIGISHGDPDVKPSLIGCQNPSESLDFKMDNLGNFLNASSSCGHVDYDSVDDCNCSFCLKAAYMLMDLHYQDTRGRLSALKRSKRIAMSLQGRICGNDYNIKTTPDSTEGTVELDLELSQRWRSLFLHTENVLVRETAQLHAALLKLKELKENCKRDLEMLSFVSSSK